MFEPLGFPQDLPSLHPIPSDHPPYLIQTLLRSLPTLPTAPIILILVFICFLILPVNIPSSFWLIQLHQFALYAQSTLILKRC